MLYCTTPGTRADPPTSWYNSSWKFYGGVKSASPITGGLDAIPADQAFDSTVQTIQYNLTEFDMRFQTATSNGTPTGSFAFLPEGGHCRLARSEGKTLMWGQRAKSVLANCVQLSEVAGLPPLSPVVVFFSALAMIDKHAVLVPPSSRTTALIASANFERSHPLGDQPVMQSIVDDFMRQAAKGDFDYVTPLDLLNASAARSRHAIEFGLSSVDIVLDGLLSAIETKIPADDLNNQRPLLGPPQRNRKYAVVIEGPGFRNDGNKYETLEAAQLAVKRLESELRGEDIVLEANAKPFGVSHPPGWGSATRIYVEKL